MRENFGMWREAKMWEEIIKGEYNNGGPIREIQQILMVKHTKLKEITC